MKASQPVGQTDFVPSSTLKNNKDAYKQLSVMKAVMEKMAAVEGIRIVYFLACFKLERNLSPLNHLEILVSEMSDGLTLIIT